MGNFSKNSLITFITEILTLILSFFVFVAIARILGPTGQGIYSLIILIPGLMLVFGSFGIESANVYFIGSRKYKIEDVAANSFVLSLLLGFVLILIFLGMLVLNPLQRFIESNSINPLYLWVAIFALPFSLLSSFFRNILRGVGDIKNYNKTRILERISQLIIIIIFLLILKKGIFAVVLSYAFANISGAFFAIYFVKKITKIHFFLNIKLLKESFIYGGKTYIANALSFLNYRLNMILIAFFLAPVAVGLYSVAVGVSGKLFIITGSLATVLFTKISSISHTEANNFTPKVVRHTLFIMIVCSVLLFLLARPLIEIILGSNFLPSVLPLIILLPGIVAFGIEGIIATDLSGRGKPQFAAYASFVCLIVNFFLNIIFIPRWGISGAAFASTISCWADTLIILAIFLKISKKPISEVLLIKKQDFQDYFQLASHCREWIVNKIKFK